jgi:hypothetical protein
MNKATANQVRILTKGAAQLISRLAIELVDILMEL